MSTRVLQASPPHTSILVTRSPFVRAVATATLAVGVLDALDGVAFFGITAHKNPIQVLQFIASGALGPSAYGGGLATAGLGALFHFAVAAVAATIYLGAYARSAAVRAHWVASGIAFGVGVWAVMNLIVVPLSAIGQLPDALGVVHGLIGHALTVGLTTSYVARRRLGA
jgi:hypothetical protein